MLNEGHSGFANHLIEKGHEMKNTDEIKIILHKENNHGKINILEEKEIMKADS